MAQQPSSFVSARAHALHHLGTQLPGAATAEEALKFGRLSGWNIRKTPAQCTVAGKTLTIPGRYAVIRDNPLVDHQVDVLGDVGASYQVIHFEDLAPLMDLIAEQSGATFDTAGELDEGRKAFVTLRLPGHAKVGKDLVDNYITVMTSHDGESSTKVMVTPVRVLNQATLNLAFNKADHLFKVRHTVGAHGTLVQQAREALEFTFNYLDGFQEQANKLANTTLTQTAFERLIERNFGAPAGAATNTVTRAQNKLDTMAELFSDRYTQEGIWGTAWAGLSALTEWADHYSPVRATDEQQARSAKALLDPAFKNKALKLMLAVA
jgi:phage/plasmid-like protein (TIGR03299 family)